MNPSGEQCYSGGLDSIISVWNIPNYEIDPYDNTPTSPGNNKIDGQNNNCINLRTFHLNLM